MGAARLVAAIAAGALAVVPAAATKEGARARLTTPLQLDASPGSAMRVEWRVDAPDGTGGLRPFGALNMFVRLLSRTGAHATTGFAPQSAGRYSTQIAVPQGGIGGIRVGLRGTTDVLFPVDNDPFRSPGGVRCDVATLRGVLAAFVAAYNRGDVRRLDRLFSRARFVWYSANAPGARVGRDASSRATLMRYFRERHRRGDRLTLVRYRFNGYARGRDIGNFDFVARRRADDFRDGAWFQLTGKGALDCARPPATIAVLSLGGPSR